MAEIKIYGTLVNATTDPKIAKTSQVFDEELNKYQSEINAQLGTSDDSLRKELTAFKNTKGKANGLASLDDSGKVPSTQLPSYVDDVLEYLNVASFPATGETGKIYVEVLGNTTYRWTGSGYVKITSGEVSSVAGKKGIVTLTKADVGLPNVDNTNDSVKNVASATKLTTARMIGGVSFDGTASINLPGVNVEGNQNTTGNSATATKLATVRTISLTGDVTGSVNFDGSSNTSISTTIPGTTAITKGGTGATTVEAARTNLSIYSKSEVDTKTVQATTSVRGTVTLATDAETLAGTDATKSVTPASFLSSLRKLVNVVGMTAHVVTAQRAFNTMYYNARDVPMRVHVGFRMPAGANANIEVDGIIQGFVTKFAAGGEEFYSLIGFVDPQKSYRFNIVGGIPFMQFCVEYYVE